MVTQHLQSKVCFESARYRGLQLTATSSRRFCLTIKGLPHKTVWVEYPDIEALCKKLGARPTSKKPDGWPLYTLPVISAPNTGAIVADSAAIARYLDRTYPDARTLIPKGADALTAAFDHAFWGTAGGPAFFCVMMARMVALLNPRSATYIREARAEMLGLNAGVGEGLEELRKGLHRITEEWLEADGREKVFVMGDEVGVTYADIILASFLLWVQKSFGEESREWKGVLEWDGGRWAKLLAKFEKHHEVDDGEELKLEAL